MDKSATSGKKVMGEKEVREVDEGSQHHRHLNHHQHHLGSKDRERDRDRERGRSPNHYYDRHDSHPTKRCADSNEDESGLDLCERSIDKKKVEYDSERINKRLRQETGPDRISTNASNDSFSHQFRNEPLDSLTPERDLWMIAPSDIGIDYTRLQNSNGKTQHLVASSRQKSPSRGIDSTIPEQATLREKDHALQQTYNPAAKYKSGDGGSQWRMSEPGGAHSVAKRNEVSLEGADIERFRNLIDTDQAREESTDMKRRSLHGQDFALNRQPTGDLYKQRVAGSVGLGSRQGSEDDRNIGSNDDDSSSKAFVQGSGVQLQINAATDQTGLNRLRAGLMKAKLRNAPDLAMLEKNYDQAVAAFALRVSNLSTKCEVVLNASHSRLIAGTREQIQMTNTTRGKKRELCEAKDNASIEDMVREERRTRGMAGGESLRIAERISKDINFNNSLDYLDENAEKLAKCTTKSGSTLKSIATHEYTRMIKILESCPLCHHEDRSPPRDLPLAPIVSLATCTFLTLSTEPELTGAEGGAVIVPFDHHTNLLECNDDEWEEIRNFMKSLTRLYHDQGRDVIFYENAAAPQRRMHAVLVAVPIPYELGNTAPAFFREAMLSADEEWSQHIKIIDTEKRAREGLGKSAFRKCIAKEMPYFHAWFSLDGGLGHIVEDGKRWPKGDLFAREVIGGMLDVDTSIVNRQGRWIEIDPRLGNFRRRWKQFDWTRVLVAS
ncbi:Pre-mRNA-splicing factor cwf19 [Sporothrix epigloea]|uniref:Pre-mRNA-splicing factor cwf19 n=1 Tax=Sporothrix epigloea TaxID=1892477 RepID=A0ABP0DEW8_9PEZI